METPKDARWYVANWNISGFEGKYASCSNPTLAPGGIIAPKQMLLLTQPEALNLLATKTVSPMSLPKQEMIPQVPRPQRPESDLPVDFPGRTVLVEDGRFAMQATILPATLDELQDVIGVGEKTAEAIISARQAFAPED